MAANLEAFVKQLTDSGVLSPGKLESFIPPQAHPKDAQDLARQLVQGKHLTKFQVQEIYQGRGRTLFLGNYTLLDRIGAGGMGQVFKAEHRRMKRVVAIKTLPKAVTNDPAAVARFQREAEAAAKLLHPNIVAAHDADEAAGVHFLVMEYIEGIDLSAYVKKNGPLPVDKAVNYILQAARGLEFAHKKGVVHRDIKPGNLLLDADGTVKVLDMGLARIDSGDVAAQSELTGTGAVMGTVDYMAPEQAMSTRKADARADIYSLGCSLFYLLTGRPTFEGETVTAKLIAHQAHPIPNLSYACPEASAELAAVFQKMIAKRVEDRYQSMTEVIADLERLAAGRPASTSAERPALSEDLGTGALTFLEHGPAAATLHRAQTTQKPKAAKQVASANKGRSRPSLWKDRRFLAAGAAGFGALLLAGVLVPLVSKSGGKPANAGKAAAENPPPEKNADSQETKTAVPPIASIRKTNRAGRAARQFDPAFQQWVKDVSALRPPAQQIEAVKRKLQELNPGFDGKCGTSFDQASVTYFAITTDSVTDVSPLAALRQLKRVQLYGNTSGNPLADLTPLQGLPLTDLRLGWGQVADLSPLAGMPLTSLECQEANVSDLSPLRGMLLTKLTCKSREVRDLSPLARMPLELLDCSGTQVSNLSPLEGMPLTFLDCSYTNVADLAPVRALPLATLYCSRAKITDLSPLKGTRLTALSCNSTDVSQLAPLAGLPLAQLSCSASRVTDLSPLKGVPLTRLECNNVRVHDLVPLRGMKLEELSCHGTQVADLSPLRGMPLKTVECWQTNIVDLTPLAGSPLQHLNCAETEVADLSPLESCRSLSKLVIRRTKVTANGVAALQRALPNCKIEWDGAVAGTPGANASGSPGGSSGAPAAAADEYQVGGEYVGELKLGGASGTYGAQVIARGNSKFELVLYNGGLPGDGSRRGDPRQQTAETSAGTVATFKTGNWTATIQNQRTSFAGPAGDDLGTLVKVERKSPTLGATPPAGAVVLFDGKSADRFQEGKLVEGNLLAAGATSKEKFENFHLHLEFRLPLEPEKRGQGRGNSGVFLQNRYELQVLDSFGLQGANNECGAIYNQTAPQVNMCLPPLAWQTYDLDFVAAQWKDGKKVQPARVTVQHNGVTVLANVELSGPTVGGAAEGPEPGPIQLQAHGNPVVYRNIWVVRHNSGQ